MTGDETTDETASRGNSLDVQRNLLRRQRGISTDSESEAATAPVSAAASAPPSAHVGALRGEVPMRFDEASRRHISASAIHQHVLQEGGTTALDEESSRSLASNEPAPALSRHEGLREGSRDSMAPGRKGPTVPEIPKSLSFNMATARHRPLDLDSKAKSFAVRARKSLDLPSRPIVATGPTSGDFKVERESSITSQDPPELQAFSEAVARRSLEYYGLPRGNVSTAGGIGGGGSGGNGGDGDGSSNGGMAKARIFESFYAPPLPSSQMKRNPLCARLSRNKRAKAIRFLRGLFPPLHWIPRYKYGWHSRLLHDIIAGVTVGIVIAPQAIAFALLADLPPIIGLYTAFLPQLMYVLLGTSRQLSVGPAALISLLVHTAITDTTLHLYDRGVNFSQFTPYAPGNVFPYSVTEEQGNSSSLFSVASIVSALVGTDKGSSGSAGASSLRFSLRASGNRRVHIGTVGEVAAAPGGLNYSSPEFQGAAVLISISLSFIVGLMSMIMGLLRLGYIVNFLAHPVLSAFSNAAAIIIIITQLPYLLDINAPTLHYPYEMVYDIFSRITTANIFAVVMSAVALVLLFGHKLLSMKKPNARYFPMQLVVVVVATALTFFLQWDRLEGETYAGLTVVGPLPAGLPKPTSPVIPWEAIPDLLVFGSVITLIGFMESVTLAKKFAIKHEYEIHPNQELIALGLANFVGSFFLSYPAIGAMSRSGLNNNAGARTAVAAFITTLFVLVIMLFLTPALRTLPICILGAIVIHSVTALMDFKDVKSIWRVRRMDFVLWLFTFCATLIGGVEIGLGSSVGLSLLFLIASVSHPRTAVLGRLPGTDVFRNVKRYRSVFRPRHAVIVRIDSAIFFANASIIKDRIVKYIEYHRRDFGMQSLRALILDFSPVAAVDVVAIQLLFEINKLCVREGISLVLCTLRGHVRDRLAASGFAQHLGRNHFFLKISDAVLATDPECQVEGEGVFEGSALAEDDESAEERIGDFNAALVYPPTDDSSDWSSDISRSEIEEKERREKDRSEFEMVDLTGSGRRRKEAGLLSGEGRVKPRKSKSDALPRCISEILFSKEPGLPIANGGHARASVGGKDEPLAGIERDFAHRRAATTTEERGSIRERWRRQRRKSRFYDSDEYDDTEVLRISLPTGVDLGRRPTIAAGERLTEGKDAAETREEDKAREQAGRRRAQTMVRLQRVESNAERRRRRARQKLEKWKERLGGTSGITIDEDHVVEAGRRPTDEGDEELPRRSQSDELVVEGRPNGDEVRRRSDGAENEAGPTTVRRRVVINSPKRSVSPPAKKNEGTREEATLKNAEGQTESDALSREGVGAFRSASLPPPSFAMSLVRDRVMRGDSPVSTVSDPKQSTDKEL